MGKIAFVFAGQGAQYSGMGRSLCEVSPAAQAVFDVADKLRPGTSQQCFTAPVEELSITENTQPCPANTKAILPICPLLSAPPPPAGTSPG